MIGALATSEDELGLWVEAESATGAEIGFATMTASSFCFPIRFGVPPEAGPDWLTFDGAFADPIVIFIGGRGSLFSTTVAPVLNVTVAGGLWSIASNVKFRLSPITLTNV